MNTEIKHIDIKAARRFLKNPNLTDLSTATTMDDAAAVVLSKCEGYLLNLNGLKKITQAAAASLAKCPEWSIELNGVTKLPTATAKALAKYHAALSLNGLTELPDDTAKALADHRGDYLNLDGLCDLSDSAAAALASHPGRLSLGGLIQLTPAAAKRRPTAVMILQGQQPADARCRRRFEPCRINDR